jgi:hypothetical protein
MTDRIYLVSDDETLKPMEATPYSREDLLQRLLEQYPDLLAGEQVDPDDPRRWLLVKREAGIAHDGDETHRWRLDHLFLDQDGVPTLVETKIAANPELRRQVVGQMLDYAANLIEVWSAERIQLEFEARCSEAGRPPEEILDAHLSSVETASEDLIDGFWTDVKTNLEAGRIRLVFVADKIPSTLLRIVEFLNGQMDPCEVIAVELRQYLHEADGKTIRTLVPRVHGLTATAKFRKKVTRTVNDPGIYILEPVAEEFEAAFGLQSRRRMHRKGWVRMTGAKADTRGEWLIYQSKSSGTINVAYDGGLGGIDEATQQGIHQALQALPLPDQVALQSGRDSTDQPYVRLEIPGFVFDDDSNWGELRDRLRAGMSEFVKAVDSVVRP